MFGWFKKKTTAVTPIAQQEHGIPAAHDVPRLEEEPQASISAENDQASNGLGAHAAVMEILVKYQRWAEPFSFWRKPQAELTPEVLHSAQLCVQSYQLTYWLEMFGARFGKVAKKMAQDAMVATATAEDGHKYAKVLSGLLEMHDKTNQYYNGLTAEERLAILPAQAAEAPQEFVVATGFLSVWHGEDATDADAIGVAECLVHARQISEPYFNEMLEKIEDFDPAPFDKWEWSKLPGAHEMHLMRRKDNAAFEPSRRIITGTEFFTARTRDDALFHAVIEEALAIRDELTNFEATQEFVDSLHSYWERINDCMKNAVRLGLLAESVERHLQHSRDILENFYRVVYKHNPEVLDTFIKVFEQQKEEEALLYGSEWLRQYENPERAIPKDELTAALLSENLDEFMKTIRAFDGKSSARDFLITMRHNLTIWAEAILETGGEIRDVQEKMDALNIAVRHTRPITLSE